MRMRRKKHLTERLSNVSKYLILADKFTVNLNDALKEKKYLDYSAIFGNDNAVSLEIGCGKGGFVTEMAIQNPNKNYIAVELLENIIVLACENALNKKVDNVRFLNTGAEYLPKYLPNGTIENIYLNFSPPYPQRGHENRRLTNKRLLANYWDMLKEGGSVLQKTDDLDFFNYSKLMFAEFGYSVEDVSEKLMNDEITNVETEYEHKFRSLGMNIYSLIATKITSDKN